MRWRLSGSLALDHLAASAGLLDLLPRRGAEAVGANGELLAQLPSPENLHRVPPLREAGGAQRLRGHLVTGAEPGVEIGHVDRLRVGAERLEAHRHLAMRAPQLAGAHVDRVLAALIAGLTPVPRARASALLAAA